MRFTGKGALVIGATEGIGRATARAFSEEGASVVIAGLGADRGRELAQELAARSTAQIVFVECDVTRERAVKEQTGPRRASVRTDSRSGEQCRHRRAVRPCCRTAPARSSTSSWA